MNTALIFAGGTGVRMQSNGTPKQFLEIFGKPTIIHTIEKFESCEIIDNIVVVCLKNWIDYLNQLLLKFNIKKVSAVISGGKTGFESRYLGLQYLMEKSKNSSDEIVLIHDGVRPMINSDLIKECVECARKNDNAVTVAKANETIIYIEDNGVSYPLDRAHCMFARAPQAFKLNKIFNYYEKAFKDGNFDMIDSATIASFYGETLNYIDGPIDNIKVTTPLDYYILRGMWEAKEYAKFFGSDVGDTNK